MLTELAEADAKGRTAEIFAEIRHLYATPYVSSIHRHLATRPGVLEWAWERTAPVFRSGEAQQLAWTRAGKVSLRPLPPIPRSALSAWGVDAAELPRIRAVAESFTRVAPVNLVFGGLLADVLLSEGGEALRAADHLPPAGSDWHPPAPLPPPPAMVDPTTLDPARKELLQLFLSGTGSTAFVPGLYRMLAHWPALLAHFAVELTPRFVSEEKQSAAAALLAGTRDVVAQLAPYLPRTGSHPAPSPDEAAHLRRMIDGYRVTSPEMILFGRLVLEALPAD